MTHTAERGGSRPAPLAICLLFASLGIVLDRLVSIPASVWLVLLAVSLLLGFVLLRRRFENGIALSSLFLVFGILAAFGCRHHLYWNRYDRSDIGFRVTKEPTPVCLRGTVRESAYRIPAPPPDPGRLLEQGEKIAFVLQAEKVRNQDRWEDVSGRVFVSIEGEGRLPRLGETLEIFGTLSEPPGARNPGGFDARAYWRTRRVLAILRVASPQSLEVLREAPLSISLGLETLRRSAQSNLRRSMSAAGSPLATAMILGFREDVDQGTEQTLRETGTAHILAISGLHIGLVAGAFAFGFRILNLPQRTSAVLLIAVVLFYLVLTDMRAPAVRAALLVCIVGCALYFNRRTLALNSLAITALIVLLRNPSELFQFGVQLSFLATSVFLWMPRYEQIFPSARKTFPSWEESYHFGRSLLRIGAALFRYCAQLFLISFTILAVCGPLLVNQLHLVTPVALLVNPLLWLPLTAALLCGFATMIAGWVCPPLAGLFGWGGSRAFEFLEAMLDGFHRIPGGAFWFPGPGFWWLIGFYVPIVLWTLFPNRVPKPRHIAIGLAVWCLIGWCGGYVRDWERLRANRLEIDVLSVGHGTCTLMLTPDGKTVVYDAGCFSRPEIGAEAISQSLWQRGKSRIDAIILSHSDTDHFNAVPELAKRFSIGAIYVSPYMFAKTGPAIRHLRESLEQHGIPIRVVSQGDSIVLGRRTNFSVLHPPKPAGGGKSEREWYSNSTSLVLLVEHNDVRTLFPGDLETKDRSLAIPFLDEPTVFCETVMIPHHGGHSNRTEPLLSWARPNAVLLSGGKLTYNPETLQKFRDRGYEVFSTFEDGCIRLTINRRGLKVMSWDHGP